MEADTWNRKYPIGQPVIVTLANRKRVPSVTRGAAFRVGQFEMVEVECIKLGAIPLSWCWPIKARR